MKSRVLTALALIPPVIYLIGWAPLWLFLPVLLLVVERSLYEYFLIARGAGFETFPALGYIAGAAACLAPVANLYRPGPWLPAFILLALLLTLSLGLVWTRDLRHYLGAAAATLFGILYLGLTLALLVPLRFGDPPRRADVIPAKGGPLASLGAGGRLMLFLFLVIWAGDIFAYLIGRSLGRHHFVPRISPKKTVEGALGGLAGSLLIGWAFACAFAETADWKTVILLAGLIAVAGQVGDLVESAMKRGADLKDSGSLLPGHGGLLDRIDSLIFAAPVLWLALMIRGVWR
ncbi:MAG TPA: phosphatidate cytidylyltransferase [Terriglobia bacterium]|nr:phosphatidate cytidylyltransferase [Terriglobia bacterium]